jgi:integrase
MARHRNNGLRKLCDCARRNWPKCAHSWYLNFKPRGGKPYRLSLDVEHEKHVETKADAEALADRIRGEIRAGTFVRAADRRKANVRSADISTPEAITVAAFSTKYLDNKVKPSGKKTWENDAYMLTQLAAFTMSDGTKFGDKALGAVTADDLDAFYSHLRAIGRAASTRNQYVQVIKASFKWAVKKGYLTRNPISDDSTLKRTKIAQRSRRLVADVLDKDGNVKEPGEERRLLAVAGVRLQWLIIAALELGARRGELLSLQWADVDRERRLVRIRAENAKDGEDRTLPISDRLAGVLEMAKTDPAGKEYPSTAYVFGEVGLKTANTKRAWETAVLKAYGHKPEWTKGTLSAASRAHLKAINLHFHDLRHEAGSRWQEAGWSLLAVRDMLGHATIDQTDTYLNSTKIGLQEQMRRFDRLRCNPVARTPGSEHPTGSNAGIANEKEVTVN